MKTILEYVKQASNFHFPRVVNEYLSTKVAKPIVRQDIIYATDETIRKIVKAELDRLGHNADLNHIDVSEVTSMVGLFNCHAAALGSAYNDLNPDISGWDVRNVKDMRYMFYKCINFNCDISSWDVINVKDMTSMFECCENFNQDLSHWDVSNVEDMGAMFEYCEKFNQDISGWNISKVRSLDTMFYNCKEFNQDLSTWDVSNVASMQSMFEGCRNFNQDLSGWDVSKVRMYYDMFKYCPIKEEYMPKFN